jgi:hypothetical protein
MNGCSNCDATNRYCEKHLGLMYFYFNSNHFKNADGTFERLNCSTCNGCLFKRQVDTVLSILETTDDDVIRLKVLRSMNCELFEIVIVMITSCINLDDNLSYMEQKVKDNIMSEDIYNTQAKRMMWISQIRNKGTHWFD